MDESPGCVPDLRSPGDLAEEPADDLSSGARCRHRAVKHGKIMENPKRSMGKKHENIY